MKSKPFFLSSKLIVVLAILISLSCADYFYNELYSAFYPEVAKVPAGSERFFFTNFYPYGENSYEYDPNDGNDSINTKSWVNYTNGKISEKTIYEGLYSGDEKFVAALRQKGYGEAAEYVTTLKEINNIALTRYGDNYWDGPMSKDTMQIKSLYPVLEDKIRQSKNDFVKERYVYLLLKTTAAVSDHKHTINFFQLYYSDIKTKTFISDWSWSNYAGALYHDGQHDKSYYEFSRLFALSATKRAEAAHSVLVYNIPYSSSVLKYCKNDDEKADVFALAAIQPQGDGLGMMKKIYDINADHQMLQHIAAREINKNEELYYGVQLVGDEYNPALNTLKSTAIDELKIFFHDVIINQKVKDKNFWYLGKAYLDYLSGDEAPGKDALDKVDEATTNSYVYRQKKLLSVLFQLQPETPYEPATFNRIYSDITSLKAMYGVRDMSAMKLISKKLSQYFMNRSGHAPGKRSFSFISGCGNQKTVDSSYRNLDLARSFFSGSLSNISGTYEDDGISYVIGGYERQYYLDSLTTEYLSHVVAFIERENMPDLDTMLIYLSDVSSNEIYLAYGRRLMLDHKFEEALRVFKKIDSDFMQEVIRAVDCSNEPELFLKSKKYQPLTDYIAYLSWIVQNKAKTVSDPTDAEAWYGLGEALINISYHGQAWILSKSSRSSAELDYYWYGQNNQSPMHVQDYENYYANKSALLCLENAARYCKVKDFCARIAYLGAMAEKNSFRAEYYKNQPKDYEKFEAYEKEQLKIFASRYRKFFTLLQDKFGGSEYEKMVLNECEEYRLYKTTR